jgi:site-specific recombinase XerD
LPQPLTDEHYRALLASFDQEKPVGRRDFAIAVCMGDLGLRCAEVAGLTLADLDETALTLRIATSKSRRGRILPLPTRAQQAVLAYVHRDRPDSRDEHLFLRHRTPRALGISRELVRGIVRRAFAQVLGCEQQTGTHVLRHTAATRLHRAGADIKRIADILGHRCIDTTVLYAKVDRDRLSTVALPWPVPEEVRS